MSRYVALIEKDGELCGVWFPQLPGCVAMGRSVDEAVRRATDALAEWIGDETSEGRTHEPESFEATTSREDVREAINSGAVAVLVTLVSETGRPMRANLSLDAGLLEAIDDAAKNRGMTRSSWVASAARAALAEGG